MSGGHLSYSPLARLMVGQMQRGGRVLSRSEREKILAAVTNKTFRRFLTFLSLIGCRPYSEAAQITAAMVDWKEGSITFLKQKNARKGKSRVVFLCEEAKQILRELSAELPEGPLFATRNGIAG